MNKLQAKTVQPASPCFQCNLFQVPEKLPECCLTDFLTWTADEDNDIRTYTPPPTAVLIRSNFLYPVDSW